MTQKSLPGEPNSPLGHLIDWLTSNTDQIVAASNFSIAIFMFVLGSIVLYYLYKTTFSGLTDLKFMMIGIVSETYGWAIHRTYWGFWRTARLYEDVPGQQWYVDHAYLALFPSIMVVLGLVLIIGPAISWMVADDKNRWQYYGVTFVLILSTWWFAYWQLSAGFEEEKKRAKEKSTIEQKLIEKQRKIQGNRIKVLVPNRKPVYLKHTPPETAK